MTARGAGHLRNAPYFKAWRRSRLFAGLEHYLVEFLNGCPCHRTSDTSPGAAHARRGFLRRRNVRRTSGSGRHSSSRDPPFHTVRTGCTRVASSAGTRCSPPLLVCCQRWSEPLVRRRGWNHVRAVLSRFGLIAPHDLMKDTQFVWSGHSECIVKPKPVSRRILRINKNQKRGG